MVQGWNILFSRNIGAMNECSIQMHSIKALQIRKLPESHQERGTEHTVNKICHIQQMSDLNWECSPRRLKSLEVKVQPEHTTLKWWYISMPERSIPILIDNSERHILTSVSKCESNEGENLDPYARDPHALYSLESVYDSDPTYWIWTVSLCIDSLDKEKYAEDKVVVFHFFA